MVKGVATSISRLPTPSPAIRLSGATRADSSGWGGAPGDMAGGAVAGCEAPAGGEASAEGGVPVGGELAPAGEGAGGAEVSAGGAAPADSGGPPAAVVDCARPGKLQAASSTNTCSARRGHRN